MAKVAKAKAAKAPAGDVVNGALVLSHLSKINEAQREAKSAQSAVQAAHKAAKAAGLVLDSLKLANKILGMDPADAALYWRRTAQYVEARAPGVLSAKDLFDGLVPAMPETLAEHDMREVEAAGHAAGLKGDRGQHEHNHAAGSEEASRWETGWRRGQQEKITREMGDDQAGDEPAAVQQAQPKRGRGRPKKEAAASDVFTV